MPKKTITTLLRLSSGLLALSLAACPGVQISHNGDSVSAASATTGLPSSTSSTSSTPAPTTAATPPAVPAPTPSTGSATLSWAAPTENEDGTPIEGLAGYRIHFGPSAAQLNQLIEVSGADSTTYVVDGLTSGTYYFAVSAYNAFGIEGPLSNIASKSF